VLSLFGPQRAAPQRKPPGQPPSVSAFDDNGRHGHSRRAQHERHEPQGRAASTRPAQLSAVRAGKAGEAPLPPWAKPAGQLVVFPSPAEGLARSDAVPAGWDKWTVDDGDVDLATARRNQTTLAEGIACRDARAVFGDLVGSVELGEHPVHRWYSYKEAYSPRLPVEVLGRLGAGETGMVADPFAGVATTALSLQHHPLVNRVVGVEYSPFAHFVGHAKLNWSQLAPKRVREHIERLRHFELDASLPVPELAALSNEEILKPNAVTSLLSARAAIETDSELSAPERDFLLLGLAAIIEDVSGVMKDGRALRILRGRSRKPKALTPRRGALAGGGVQATLVNQWLAMAEDLRALAPMRPRARARRDLHLKGDARDLATVGRRGHRQHPLADGSIGLCVYSPPYLNCIDYTEVYKLELWLLGFVSDQEEFREVRLGTLRSHPSIRFEQGEELADLDAPVVEVIEHIAEVLDRRLPRPGLGEMSRNYFEDMYRVFVEQYRVLEPGGHAVCVVANSTFSRRETGEAGRQEAWRLPLLTDVLIARLAEAAGFAHVEIWEARALRPRNVRAGSARESLVVGRKG
jgi:hypothetical protein